MPRLVINNYDELANDIEEFARQLTGNATSVHLAILLNRILKGIDSNVIVKESHFK